MFDRDAVDDFAELLAALKQRTGRSFEALGGRAGVAASTLHRWCRGERVPPDFAAVGHYARACGVTRAEMPEVYRRWVRADVVYRGGRRAPSADRPAQLPPDVAGFAGREEYLRELDAVAGAAGSRRGTATAIAAIAGTAGVGKTALAVHWAHGRRDRFPDGQLYVNLRGFDPARAAVAPAEALRGFLNALGVPESRTPIGVAPRVGLYRSLLADRRMLVVLDNARDEKQVRPLLPGAPGCQALVTSRNALAGLVAAEAAHAVEVDLLDAGDALALLAGRLGPARLAAEPGAADRVIAACAGLPLALAVMAARAATVPERPLAVLVDELSRTRGTLDAFTGPDAATDLRAVFATSYRTLNPASARLFLLLGVAAGPELSAPAVAGLAEVPLAQARPALADLVRAHLVNERGPAGYTVHDLLRAYARELVGRRREGAGGGDAVTPG